jgi:hypothetical protein
MQLASTTPTSWRIRIAIHLPSYSADLDYSLHPEQVEKGSIILTHFSLSIADQETLQMALGLCKGNVL